MRTAAAESVIETEETLIIETPERVPLAFALASIGNRSLAVAIDHIIQFVSYIAVIAIGFSIAGAFGFGGPDSTVESLVSEAPKWVIALVVLLLFLVFSAYFIIFEWIWEGQTPGKRLMKLRVIREDGRPITLWESAARNLIRVLDAAPGFVIPIYSVGLITIFLSNRDQRFGDIFAGTVVIRERSDEAPTFDETFSNPVADGALRRVQKPLEMQADIAKLTFEEVEVAENFLRRRWDLTDRQRQWMAWRIALPMMFKLKPQYTAEDFTYEGFLEEVVHRFSARARFLN